MLLVFGKELALKVLRVLAVCTMEATDSVYPPLKCSNDCIFKVTVGSSTQSCSAGEQKKVNLPIVLTHTVDEMTVGSHLFPLGRILLTF